MKLAKFILSLVGAICVAAPLAAQEESFLDRIQFSVAVDTAFYPRSDRISGTGDIFAPLTGAYSGLEGRVTGKAEYTIPTPLGENWLVSGANLNLSASLEVTPVSVKPALSAAFTPVPFFIFSAGAEAGTGWDIGTVFQGGMAKLNTSTWNYNALTPFANWFYKTWFQGTFQFDFGAIIPGDWTHVVTQCSYQLYYNALTNVNRGEVWEWQLTGNRVNGWNQYCNFVLAYQMPSLLKMAGVMVETDKRLSSDAYDSALYGKYDSDWNQISISPLLQFQFGGKDTLSCLLGFSSRRRFVEAFDYDNSQKEPTLTTSGREWYFSRVAISYSHKF